MKYSSLLSVLTFAATASTTSARGRSRGCQEGGALVTLVAVNNEDSTFTDPFADGYNPVTVTEVGTLDDWKTVTFTVKQSWSNDRLDALYTVYDAPEGKCAANGSVAKRRMFTYTATCMKHNNKAIVTVFASGGDGDDLEKPKCCKPKDIDTAPKTSWTFEVECTCTASNVGVVSAQVTRGGSVGVRGGARAL